MNRADFYASLRRRNSGLFGTSLSQSQVDGIEAVLDEAVRRATPLNDLAYILATDYHETGAKMQPVRENLNYSVSGLLKSFGRHRITEAEARKYGRSGSRKADQVAIANIIYGGEWGREYLGNTQPGDGWIFRGGGLPQLTGRGNFRKYGLEDNPDAITDLKTSVRVMFDGMEQGELTGKSLDDFIDDIDESDAEDLREFIAARKIINGTDKAEAIGKYALAFEKALKAAGYTGKDGNVGGDEALGGPAQSQSSVVSYINQHAIRDRPVTADLEAMLSDAVTAVYGVGSRCEIYSGGQTPKGKVGKRTGSVRHDDSGKGGRAADVYVYGPDNRKVTGLDLVRIGQYWLAKGNGGVGALMSNNGIHLDEWSTPPPGGGMFWTYSWSDRQPWGNRVRDMLITGNAGTMPSLPDPEPGTLNPGNATGSTGEAQTPPSIITALRLLIIAIAAAFGGDAIDIISKLGG